MRIEWRVTAMPKRLRSLRCPACRTLVPRSAPDFPFCSERCRLIDLGKWASGKYVISRPISEPEAAALNEEQPSRDDNRD